MWGVYVDDLLIAGQRSLNDSIIRSVQEVWKTSAPEHLGPDLDAPDLAKVRAPLTCAIFLQNFYFFYASSSPLFNTCGPHAHWTRGHLLPKCEPRTLTNILQ